MDPNETAGAPSSSTPPPAEVEVETITTVAGGPIAEKGQSPPPSRDQRQQRPQSDARDISTVRTVDAGDPLDIGRLRRENLTDEQLRADHPQAKGTNRRELRKYYERQNELIDQYLGAVDEERVHGEESNRVGPKVRFAVNASFTVNFCLFVIQLYAAISTGSLSVGPHQTRRIFHGSRYVRIGAPMLTVVV